jgi:hypothetical protein
MASEYEGFTGTGPFTDVKFVHADYTKFQQQQKKK